MSMIPLEVSVKFPETVIEIVVTLVLALVCRFALRKVIDRAVARATQRQGEHGLLAMGRSSSVVATTGGVNTNRSMQRAKTLGSVLKSMTDVVLIIVVVLMVLNSLNINIGPALASAGIVGVAVGFGAQSLFKDLFSGVFMLAEDQYGVGDIIEVNKLKGTVRSVGFRVTELQDFNGEVWYVRNGEISTVGNVSQGFTSSLVTIPVSVDESPKLVIRLLARMLKKMDSEPDWHNKMLEEPSMLGLSALDATTASYQISIKCPANSQWDVEREIRSRALSTLSQAGVRMPVTRVATVPPHTADETMAMPHSRRRRLGQLAQQRMAERHATDQSATGRTGTEPAGEATQEPSAEQGTPPTGEVIRRPAEPGQAAADSRPTDAAQAAAGPASDQVVPADDTLPAPKVKAADTGQLRKARAWLDHGADRSVRWVAQATPGASEVHDMTADQTVLMSADDVLRRPDQADGTGRTHRSTAASGTTASGTAASDTAASGSGTDGAKPTGDRPGADPSDPRTGAADSGATKSTAAGSSDAKGDDEASKTRSLRAIDTGHQPGANPEQGTGDPAPQSGDRSDPSEPPADQTRRLFGRRGRKRD
ncbi:hypothetical protein EFN18_11560 [Propionibacterium freudenreichii]|nr:hypothetical protein [Propionibacterium freudenreichii]